MTRSRAGFTVVELMIALTCGGIAISSMYVIGASSMRTFRAQDRIATTQSSLRSALAQVKRDFQRAGFLSTPNIDLQSERCTPPVTAPLNDASNTYNKGRLAAISAYQQKIAPSAGGFSALDPGTLNKWNRIDDVILTGNFATSGEYMGVLVSPSGTTISVPFTTQGFARDFTHWFKSGTVAAGSCNDGALQSTFSAGRLLRVHTLSELNAYMPIKSSSCNTVTSTADIELDQALPGNCNATAGWMSPLNVIRYWVKDATGSETTRGAVNRSAVLRRTEVDPIAKEKPLQITDAVATRIADDRAVLDFVVHFRVDFLMRDSDVNSIDFVPATPAMVAANPERVRGAIIELGARTSEHEPDMDVTLLGTTFPPFRVYDTPGGARTRVLKAELLLPNISQRAL